MRAIIIGRIVNIFEDKREVILKDSDENEYRLKFPKPEAFHIVKSNSLPGDMIYTENNLQISESKDAYYQCNRVLLFTRHNKNS